MQKSAGSSLPSPECASTKWKRPLPQPCPKCGGLLVAERKGMARCTVCGELVPVEQEAVPAGER